MVIEGMISGRNNFIWSIIHVILGVLCTITPVVLICWFYFILFSNFSKSTNLLSKNKPVFFIALFSYLISFELLDRMAKTSPFIPYELGKYFLVLVGILGILYLGIRSHKGIWLVVLITPALFYDFSGERKIVDVINNYIGPLAIGLGIAFADKLLITKNSLHQILKMIFWGCLSSLIFTYIKTPDFEDIEFSLTAQFDTTGGHSSNQVSTILGLGMFLSFYSLVNNLKFSGFKILDILILTGFTFQGLLTFSRGGMMVGAVAILLLLILPKVKLMNDSSSFRNSTKRSISMVVIIGFSIYGVFEVANGITGGNLLLRYQGETQGTLLGSKEKTANNITTGRIDILEKDFLLFFKYPLTGVGCGISQYLRDKQRGKVASHLELSRLFADHGILGAIAAYLLFIYIPFRIWTVNRLSQSRNILFVLLILALLTTFHAAMRTYLTPLFIILGILKVRD